MKAFLLIGVLAIAGAGAWAYVALQRSDEPYRGYDTPAQIVSIPSGSSTAAIGRALVDAGVVRDDLTFRLTLWRTGDARRLKAGDYRFEGSMTARDVVGKIARGEVDELTLTFREGLTIKEMAPIYEASGLGSAREFLEAARDASLVASLDPAAPDLEGYLFPDTYSVPRGTDAKKLTQIMVDRFAHELTTPIRTAAADRGLSIRQLVTLASIVEKETGQAAERPTVAAVYQNRLNIKMGLQCDPTVIYALEKAGRYDGNLRRDDLSFDSPYNTYRYAGLPPGPIAAPGKASLEAAASPAEVDYLYFVSRNDGSHAFARTLTEHNQNVQKFQVDYFRARRER